MTSNSWRWTLCWGTKWRMRKKRPPFHHSPMCVWKSGVGLLYSSHIFLRLYTPKHLLTTQRDMRSQWGNVLTKRSTWHRLQALSALTFEPNTHVIVFTMTEYAVVSLTQEKQTAFSKILLHMNTSTLVTSQDTSNLGDFVSFPKWAASTLKALDSNCQSPYGCAIHSSPHKTASQIFFNINFAKITMNLANNILGT